MKKIFCDCGVLLMGGAICLTGLLYITAPLVVWVAAVKYIFW